MQSNAVLLKSDSLSGYKVLKTCRPLPKQAWNSGSPAFTSSPCSGFVLVAARVLLMISQIIQSTKKWGTIPQKYTKIGVYHACLFLVKLGWVLWYFTLLPWKEIYRLDWECGTPQSQPTVYQYIFQLKLAAIVWDMGMFIIDTPIYWSSKNISSIYMYLHNNNP